jgi:hypothetical protein
MKTVLSCLLIVFVMVLLTASCSLADDASKMVKIKELMKVQGLDELIEQQKIYCEAQAKEIGEKTMQQFRNQLPNIDKDSAKALDAAFQRFLNQAKPTWTAEEAVAAWGTYYGANITENELDKILAFYKSPEGQKDISATKAAMPYWSKFFQEKNGIALEKATQAYITELKAILGAEKPK